MIDRALASDRWLAGDALSLADISLAPYVGALGMLDAAHVASGLAALADWWTRISARHRVTTGCRR